MPEPYKFTMVNEDGRRILNIHLFKPDLDYLKALNTMSFSAQVQGWSDFGFISEIRLIGMKDK